MRKFYGIALVASLLTLSFAQDVPDGAHSHANLEAETAAALKKANDLEAIVIALEKRVKALEDAEPPAPPPPPPTVGVLQLGAGALPNPEPEDSAGANERNPITDDVRPASLLYGASKLDVNFYDNSDSGPIHRVVAWSLEGGAWTETRNGLVKVPADLPDGKYQLRTVVFPPTGLSVPQPIHYILKATVTLGDSTHTFIEYQ